MAAITLLPASSTSLERNIAQAGADIELIDATVIVRVTRVDDAPVDFLPYLAWEVSVDRWSDAWPEATKRQVIKESFYVHKRKGTIASLRRVVEPFGYLLKVVEWFQETPPGPRGTFRLDIGVNNEGITEEVYLELERLIADTKPLSRHMLGLNITLLTRGTCYIGATTLLGDTTTVYPPDPQDIEISSAPHYRAATHIIDTVSVRPLL
ncbi:phage tail protein I [Paracandidimonas soli]|uniref:Phage tail P2-like protein n=1 Tax=Paracandidimonas soli TaxID=1917182 RepID=A0A4R3V6A8_9BURK|nr:phage tail protein I [Paracandidimonas soli]TCV00516.1 phage tail P2-like protein [Paracandidimonas soli]